MMIGTRSTEVKLLSIFFDGDIITTAYVIARKIELNRSGMNSTEPLEVTFGI